jgi:hypothetical protein
MPREFNNFLPLLPPVCALCVSSALAVLAFGCSMSLIPGAHFKTRVILYNGYVFHRNKIVEKTGTTYYNWIDEEGPEAFSVHDRRHRTNNAIESFHSILMRYIQVSHASIFVFSSNNTNILAFQSIKSIFVFVRKTEALYCWICY